ncbi:MAG TPA: hypothetical protein VNA16_10695, partial [Abditibacteriaceae bacterium]|nr:hypothetical protein [Abditibacteriaceae bacterium]
IGHDAVLLWDDMGSGAWLHNLPDGARRELPSKLHNGETLTLSLESVWRYDGASVEVLDLATAKVLGSWRCKAWHPTAARVADGLCWLACVAERNSEDHALLCIDPGQRRSTLITELPLVENLTALVVTPDLVVLLGRTPAAAEVELPAALRKLEQLAEAARRRGVRGLLGKARLYKTLLSDAPGLMGTMGVLHETATGVVAQPAALSAIAVRRADGNEQWRQTLAPSAPGGTTEHRVTPTAREHSVFAAIAQEVFRFEADTGAVTAQQFAGTLLALPDHAQPCAWIAGENHLAAWQLIE